MGSTEHHCPKCGSSAATQEFWAIIFDFNNWPQLILGLVLIFGVAAHLGLSMLEFLGFGFLALAGMTVSVRRKNFCLDCEIEFSNPPVRLPTPKNVKLG